MRTYLLRLWGSGRLPRAGRRAVEAEHCRLLIESTVGSIAQSGSRNPGQDSSGRRKWFLGSLALSDKRFVAYRYGSCLLNLPWTDSRLAALDFSAETPGELLIVYDASVFRPTDSGEVQICFLTPEALAVCSLIASRVRRRSVHYSARKPRGSRAGRRTAACSFAVQPSGEAHHARRGTTIASRVEYCRRSPTAEDDEV